MKTTRNRTLALIAATAALALMPAAEAGAETFDGRCVINGQASFSPGLFFSFFDENNYKLTGLASLSSCSGTLDGQPFEGPVAALVTGEANMACQGAGGMGGRGSIDFDPALATGDPGKRVVSFDFQFIGPVAAYGYHVAGDGGGNGFGAVVLGARSDWPDRCRTSGVGVRGADMGTALVAAGLSG